MLSVNNLSYINHNKIFLKDISATFNDGEIIGITGAAGSGKSLFIDMLRNRHRNYFGNIIINGNDIKTLNKKKFKTIVSHYSSNEDVINPEAIVKDWILAGRINHKKKLSSYTDEDREIAFREMTNFALTEFAETRLKMISKTYQKMASLAKVFSTQSETLLLEKPEAGLNINQKTLLTKCIKKYTIKGNNIVILTSSDLNFLAATCDRIIILADNSIAESGTHKIITGEFIKKYFNVEAVVTNNIYSGLPEIQIIEES